MRGAHLLPLYSLFYYGSYSVYLVYRRVIMPKVKLVGWYDLLFIQDGVQSFQYQFSNSFDSTGSSDIGL